MSATCGECESHPRQQARLEYIRKLISLLGTDFGPDDSTLMDRIEVLLTDAEQAEALLAEAREVAHD